MAVAQTLVVAVIRPLAWEIPYAAGAAIKKFKCIYYMPCLISLSTLKFKFYESRKFFPIVSLGTRMGPDTYEGFII